MSHDQELVALEAQPAVRSGVRIEMNAKGQAQVKVSVYVGDTEQDLQEAKDLAVRTYQATVLQINATQGLSTP